MSLCRHFHALLLFLIETGPFSANFPLANTTPSSVDPAEKTGPGPSPKYEGGGKQSKSKPNSSSLTWESAEEHGCVEGEMGGQSCPLHQCQALT